MTHALPGYVCPEDGTEAGVRTAPWCCPVCGGPWDLDFTPDPAVPLEPAAGPHSLWRYGSALPLPGAFSVTLSEGHTPLVPLTERIHAKLDFLMPTLSFKDRGAVMLAELARRLGPQRVVADSSGNAGTAFAAYCARAGLSCEVFVPQGTSEKKTEQMRAHGASVRVVPGGREAAAEAARAAADEPGVFYASHVFNPYFLHGTKTYVYEVWEELGGRLPETLVLPVGNGTLLLGAALAVEELARRGVRPPALIAVQSEAVAPLATAFAAGAEDADPVEQRPTLAEGIAIPAPPRARQILAAVRKSGGAFLTVPDDRLREAQRDLARRGLYVEPTAAACWAAVGPLSPSDPLQGRTTVLPLCGAGAKSGLKP
ncbi:MULTISPECIES: pyridoxal-phosphate dependent enzyme [unclassified Streptomyces]|uniref:pyridoxal-phosphate dependent enzyme n=1 Tax=unclassified Streptomyces TaxID=2593676 RepID=UPI001BE604D6|nr:MULTISPECIES: pyridoxal-phosphate dependent enzyme [unclassified Streptomyces]MBT2405398.1 pyridoxal-phosphate dependent enzyme [Streptomyces sp. ISL-21]MBT2613237.1 pyridoxal-phosphate dependent enzyme [Streptomyces sp. ISL-87]